MIGDAATAAAFGSYTAVLNALGVAAVALAVGTLFVSPPDGFAPAGDR